MRQTGYPLHVMHGYSMSAKEALEFSELVQRVDPETLDHIEVVAKPRRELLPYGALVLGEILRVGRPKRVVLSALGVREGLLHELLPESAQREDPLIAAANDLNILRSRSPLHGAELVGWTNRFMSSTGIEETPEEQRLRHAACLLADIGWRAHPEYRGEQSLNIIAHAAFVGIDHPGRAFLALAVFYRHAGLGEDEPSPLCASSRQPAFSTAHAFSARPCASPISYPPRCRAYSIVRRSRWRRGSSCCGSKANSRRSKASGCSTACASLANSSVAIR
jgi:exopolyphosphatase/guanosine-5'-triphosphate,3'-diphosphate pyrophosphatase